MITGLKRTISIALCAAMLAASIPVNSEAHWDTGDKEKPVSISTREDGTVEVEDSWEETYPYGAFLFDNSESAVAEGGNEVTIPLYRLGGTKGRATAYIAYAPVVAIMGNETPAYGLAAGSDDVQISVENPLPIAQYQAVGKDADPDPSEAAIKEAEYVGSDAEPGDRSLTIEPQADGYQWYILHEGRWKIVEGAVKAEFVVSKDMMEDADFRCVYEKGGKKFCSMSYRGEAYEKPEPEVTEEAPNDIDLKPEKTFTDLDLSAGDPYSPAMFSVTFADGEWMKEIKVKAPNNEDADPIRMGTFTILDNQGGAIFEKASTVTLSVMDNDKGKPYSIGFEEKKVSADKAVGGAVVHLKRTGGGQDMISLDWKTADGTAKAGEDYESKTGTALFYADIDEVTIEIPLIDDGVKSNKEKTFSIELGELKGDPDGLCTLADSAIEVSVTNSGEGRSKFGSFLTIDPPGTEPEEEEEGPVTGQQVITPDEDLLYGEIAGYDGGETQSDGSGMDPSGTFDYGRISFDGKQHGGSYWEDKAYIAGKPNNDITGWSGGSAYGNGWQVESDDYKNSSISIPNMKSMYSGFYGNFEWNAALAKGWTLTWYGCCWAYGGAEVTSGKFSKDCNPRDTSHDLTYEVTWTTRGSIDTSWNMSENVNGVKLWISKNKDHNIGHDAYSRITEGYLNRRIFDNDLNLRIHTANDGESGDGNVVTAPDGAASLKKDSGVYASMKPEVLIEESNGGVNSSGKVYVGSKLRITLKNTDSYKPYSGSALNAAVYVTRKDGRIAPCKVEPGSNGIYYVTMLWDGIDESDLEDTYTINIVMTRNQEIELNLRPSVPRKVDDKGQITPDIDTDKVGEAWDTFWRSGADHITLGVSNALHDAPHFGKKELSEIRIDRTEWVSGDKNPLKNLGRYENVQYINFNRNKKDVITLNGSRHKGNEKIYLATSDLAFAKVSFTYYNEQYLNMPNIMSTSITRTEVYFDGDGDGKISGKYNESTGYFELDKDGKDTFEFYMDEGCNYDEKMFQPVELEGGKFGQFFAKIFYTMTPRYLDKPDDVPDSDRAQVLPAFTTSRTDTEMLSRLTEEQNSYRYIISGQDGSGNRTADGHIMYGEKANAMQYVDVPLGGDHSPLQNRSEDPAKEDDMEWNPDYEGSLIYPFTNPEPIFVEHSLVGDNFPIAEFSYDNGVTTDAAAKDKLNGYLGSFTGDTTIALCVTKQEHTTDELHGDPESVVSLKPESSSLIDRSASPNGDWASKTDGGDMGNTSFDSGAAEHDYSEFDMDYGVNMPSMKGSLPQGLVTVVTGKNMFTILVSVPIYSKVKGKEGKFFPNSVKDPFNLTKDELKGLGDKMKTGSYDQLLDQWDKAGYKDSKSNKSIVCNKMSFSLNFSMSFTVKYDTDTNNWYFQEFAAGIGGTFSFKYTVRLAACPLLYGYLAVTAGITVGSGGTISHKVVESQKPIVPENTDHKLKTGESLEFNTDYVNMLIRFKGKVYVEALDKKGDKEPSSGTRKGYISSNGESRVQVQFKDASDSMKFSSTKYVRIVALKDTSISYLNTIETVKSELLWSGVSVKPSLNVEIGVGAGVELAKLEAFIKLNISANFVFGQEQGDGSFKGFQVQSASFTLGLAIRATFLMFTFEMDAIAIKGSYAKSTDKWTWAYTVFGKDHPISAASSGGGGSGSSLQLPRDVSKTQTIYSSQKEPAGSGDGPLKPAQAYDPGDQFVPFQLSGYNSQSDALRLADGLDLNYSYRVVTVNDETKSVNNENYVVYMIGRPGSKGLDTSMLAVSRLVTTDEGDGAKKEEESGNDNPGSDEDYGDGLGLVNPLDWEYREVKDGDKTYKYRAVKHPSERSETPYILIDLKKEGKNLVDDGTGDLE
ncbi:MAG: hypothetical protein IJT00_10245, partial [Lachnospiraceae bacterium]|nr:hypothetical protein [Lachnospiraceae bacterium]